MSVRSRLFCLFKLWYAEDSFSQFAVQYIDIMPQFSHKTFFINVSLINSTHTQSENTQRWFANSLFCRDKKTWFGSHAHTRKGYPSVYLSLCSACVLLCVRVCERVWMWMCMPNAKFNRLLSMAVAVILFLSCNISVVWLLAWMAMDAIFFVSSFPSASQFTTNIWVSSERCAVHIIRLLCFTHGYHYRWLFSFEIMASLALHCYLINECKQF